MQNCSSLDVLRAGVVRIRSTSSPPGLVKCKAASWYLPNNKLIDGRRGAEFLLQTS